jgi:hypothetical protein
MACVLLGNWGGQRIARNCGSRQDASPDTTLPEGPFGEFTGYYATEARPAPVMEVTAVHHRDDPIDKFPPTSALSLEEARAIEEKWGGVLRG